MTTINITGASACKRGTLLTIDDEWFRVVNFLGGTTLEVRPARWWYLLWRRTLALPRRSGRAVRRAVRRAYWKIADAVTGEGDE